MVESTNESLDVGGGCGRMRSINWRTAHPIRHNQLAGTEHGIIDGRTHMYVYVHIPKPIDMYASNVLMARKREKKGELGGQLLCIWRVPTKTIGQIWPSFDHTEKLAAQTVNTSKLRWAVYAGHVSSSAFPIKSATESIKLAAVVVVEWNKKWPAMCHLSILHCFNCTSRCGM